MKTLSQLLNQPLRRLPSSIVVAVFVIAILGFVDATYLSVEHFLGLVPPCTITAGCEQVLTSPYAVVLGIPVALVGSVYYLLIAVGSFIFLESKHVAKLEKHNSEVLRLSLFLTIPGFLASLWFSGAQIFIIHSYCAYCIGSALLTTALFVLSVIIFVKYGRAQNDGGQIFNDL
jgi:uncharacterized membrane protein